MWQGKKKERKFQILPMEQNISLQVASAQETKMNKMKWKNSGKEHSNLSCIITQMK
jgi:hypothetical protein